MTRVISEQRPDFEAAFNRRWAGRLFDSAVVPAWRAGEQQVLDAVQVYVNDFVARRLLTEAGGPQVDVQHGFCDHRSKLVTIHC